MLTAGDIHGARALLTRDESYSELVAASDVRVVVYDRRSFSSLIATNAGFARGVARQLATPRSNRRNPAEDQPASMPSSGLTIADAA